MDGTCSGFFVLLIVLLTIVAAVKGMKAYSEKRELEQLRRANPQAWVELQRMEVERQRMEHERQMLENHHKHEYSRVGVNVGLWLLKNWFQ